MKKLILICLLGYLCVPTSTLTAQVADPPGADFLHRSVSEVSSGVEEVHRGGDARPDTLTPEPGVYHSADSLRREGILYIEIQSPDPPDTLWVTFWEHLLKDRKAVTPGISMPLPGIWGNMFEGSSYSKVYEVELPSGIPSGYFSLGRGISTMADQWSFTSADRVRIKFDRIRSTVLFGGPDADFYRAQYLISEAFSEMAFNRDPVMVTGSGEILFSDSLSNVLYQKAQHRPDDIYARARILTSDQASWELFGDFVINDVERLAPWRILQDYRDRLTEEQYQGLKARIVGEVLNQGLTWAELAKEAFMDDSAKMDFLAKWQESLKTEQVQGSHPLLIQGENRWIGLMATLSGKSYREIWEKSPSPRKEEVLTLYLLERFNMLGEELPALVNLGLDQIRIPWLRDRIEALDTLHESPLISDGLKGIDGQPIDLTAFRGKTLLIHFWITGCKFCMADFRSVIKDLAEKYASSQDVMLVSINVDRNTTTWIKSLESGNYSSPLMLNLKATPDSGMAAYYRIHSFPQKMIVDAGSRIRVQTIHRPDKSELIDVLDSIRTRPPLLPSTQTF
ncbi:TlpA disulfide reductase family protein [Algoriphagus halophytocola]|uniref:TlpA family protein disulfide reductase n=1 Tax=Algoriphagus halophytocola TaxID=2991499 RepID=UPI0022DD17F8|nr:TlpA disulfide reductase family protein [Algoriphagus sp. TR-M9]WBL43022.1 TlpA disulfide reductase family protein [Algoriphagus sp. TR-M9]